MLLVLRRYGVYKVFDSSDGLSQPVLRRESSGPSGSSLRALEGELREQEESPGAQERERSTLARCFKQSDLALPTGGWSNQSVCMGRSPACTRHLIFHSFRERYTQVFISVVNMHDAKV